jgi:hypothetical protein
MKKVVLSSFVLLLIVFCEKENLHGRGTQDIRQQILVYPPQQDHKDIYHFDRNYYTGHSKSMAMYP